MMTSRFVCVTNAVLACLVFLVTALLFYRARPAAVELTFADSRAVTLEALRVRKIPFSREVSLQREVLPASSDSRLLWPLGRGTVLEEFTLEGRILNPNVPFRSLSVSGAFGDLTLERESLAPECRFENATLTDTGLLSGDGTYRLTCKGLLPLILRESPKPLALAIWCSASGLAAVFLLRSFRRKSAARKAFAPLVLAWLTLVQIGAVPFAGEVNSPTALLPNHAAWAREGTATVPLHPEHTDSLDSHLPKWREMKRSLRQGEIPWVLFSRAGGEPGILSPQNETFGPFFWMFAAFPSDVAGFAAVQFSKIFLMALGTYVFLRRFVSSPGALFAAATFPFTGFNVAWFYMMVVSNVVWIPWLFWAWARAVETRTPTSFLFVTLFASLLGAGGFPAIAGYTLYALALFHLALYGLWGNRGRTWMATTAVLTLAGLAAGLLIALPAGSLEFQLRHVDLSYRKDPGSALDPSFLIQFLTPFREEFGGGVQKETMFYGGLLPLVLLPAVVLAITSPLAAFSTNASIRRLGAFSLALLALTILIIFKLLPRGFVNELPFFGSSLWSRFSVMTGFAMAIAGAIGVHVLTKGRSFTSLAPHALAAVVLAIGLQTMDLRRQFRKVNTISPGTLFFPRMAALDFLEKETRPMQGVLADGATGPQGLLSGYGAWEWCAHTFKPDALTRLVVASVENGIGSPTSCHLKAESIHFDRNELDHLAVRWVISSASKVARVEERIAAGREPDTWRKAYFDGDIVVFENLEAPIGPYRVEEPGRIEQKIAPIIGLDSVDATLGRIRVRIGAPAETSQWIVLPVTATDAFVARWNGTPIPGERHLGLMPAVRVTGSGVLEYAFHPPFLPLGILLTCAGLTLALAIPVILRARPGILALGSKGNEP